MIISRGSIVAITCKELVSSGDITKVGIYVKDSSYINISKPIDSDTKLPNVIDSNKVTYLYNDSNYPIDLDACNKNYVILKIYSPEELSKNLVLTKNTLLNLAELTNYTTNLDSYIIKYNGTCIEDNIYVVVVKTSNKKYCTYYYLLSDISSITESTVEVGDLLYMSSSTMGVVTRLCKSSRIMNSSSTNEGMVLFRNEELSKRLISEYKLELNKGE